MADLGVVRTSQLDALQAVATGRASSFLDQDMAVHQAALTESYEGSIVAVAGAAGSIGAATVREIIHFRPSEIILIDMNENGLVDLVRRLRTTFSAADLPRISVAVLDVSGSLLERYFVDRDLPDHFLNFSAIKHVRSERDAVSLLRMMQVNVVAMSNMTRLIDTWDKPTRLFSVSTDKAANPVNFMGASKRLMEEVMFSGTAMASSARFANVAFSQGSLLESWLDRIRNFQPIPVPEDTRRYFVSMREAGQLCVMAAGLLQHGQVAIPRLDPVANLVPLEEVARGVLATLGLSPVVVDDEEEAMSLAKAGRLKPNQRVLLLTPLNTQGEKEYEEFVGLGDSMVESRFSDLSILTPQRLDARLVTELAHRVDAALRSPQEPFAIGEFSEELRAVLPVFAHRDAPLKLDDRV